MFDDLRGARGLLTFNLLCRPALSECAEPSIRVTHNGGLLGLLGLLFRR